MKKLLIIFSIWALAGSAAYSQDNQDNSYYTGDQDNVETTTQTAPPELPQYTQPPCPADGYFWQPGYWAWAPAGYYWVPGVWVLPPHPGLLWTPGWWGFYNGFYGWHRGYWGPHVGFYGGVNYGFGYWGTGFYGGRWDGGVFRYNTAVWHVNGAAVHNVYVDRSVVRNVTVRSSFNGPGGVRGRPSEGEMQAMHESHEAATHEQVAHHQAMASEKAQFHTVNHGNPPVHSMSKPGGQRFNAGGHAVGGRPAGGGGRR